jgi:hypothetical protein
MQRRTFPEDIAATIGLFMAQNGLPSAGCGFASNKEDSRLAEDEPWTGPALCIRVANGAWV